MFVRWNLPYSFRERDVIEYFERCGPIRNITVGFNRRTGQSKGYAFVEFEHRRDAEDAFDRYNGYDFDGRRLRIDWDVGLDKKVQGRRKTSTRFVCFVLFILKLNFSRSKSHSRGRSYSRSKSRSRSPPKAITFSFSLQESPTKAF